MKKTIALTCILKNEAHNLARFCESVAGLFDEYHFTDTGSTDGSVDFLETKAAQILKCDPSNLHIHHFKWIDNFAAARNHALPMIKTDYWFWNDLDDVLANPVSFKAWRDEAMSLADVWYLPYHYAVKEDGTPIVSFIRERVIKTNTGLQFQDFVHEGVDVRKANRPVTTSLVQSFSVKHMRTTEEMEADRGRNLKILEDNKDILSPRLEFYFGKELFDHKRYEDAVRVLKENVKRKDVEQGDRVMAFQYLVHSLNMLNQHDEAIKYGILGIQMEPHRAEYHCLVADSYAKLGDPIKAIPFFGAAKHCINVAASGVSHEFTFGDGYSFIPRMNLAHIYAQQGKFEEALAELAPLSDEKSQALKDACLKAIKDMHIPLDNELTFTDDIVITCPHPPAYAWDEKIYQDKGLGGSETAAVEMAMQLKRKFPDRRVIIFQHRENTFLPASGVEYIPAPELHSYFAQYKPDLHIAWRHTAHFTNARTFVWSHDLITVGAENVNSYDKILALSEFHKNYLVGSQGVPPEKILVTRNGIEPKRFEMVNNVEKDPNRVVWPNSPDRGLEWAIKIMDLVREEIPEATLHCYYGFNNMDKYGLKAQADALRDMIKARPWIKYHGNVDQKTLAMDMMKSSVWLYPANFAETFCITAIEALSAKTFPVVREFAALKSTLKEAQFQGMADVIDCDPDESLIPLFAEHVISAIKEKKWERINVDPKKFSWESVAQEWIDLFQLIEKEK